MSYINTKVAAIVADYPAYSVVSREKSKGAYVNGQFDPAIEFTDIVAWESLCIAYESRNHGTMYAEQEAGSVASYAMKNGECPIEAIDRARERKHDLHWINAQGSCITAHKRAKEVWTLIENNSLVRFEGRIFTFVHDKHHARLIPFAK